MFLQPYLTAKKELLDNWTAITHLRLDKYFFFNKQDAQDILQTPDRNNIPLFARGSDAGIEDKEPDAWSGPDEGDWESCCYCQYYSPTCNHWTINYTRYDHEYSSNGTSKTVISHVSRNRG